MKLSEDVGFGVGWGLPWARSAVFSIFTVLFIKSALKNEKAEWRPREVNKVGASV